MGLALNANWKGIMKTVKKLNVHDHLWDIGDNTVELLLQKMDQLEIEITCITYGARHLFQEYDCNDLVEAAFKKYPHRLCGMGFVHLGVDGPSKVRELKDRGFAGLKIIYPAVAYNDESAFPVYQEAEKLKMPCLFHLGPVSTTSSRPKGVFIDSNRMRAGMLDPIARECPQLRIIGAHMGWLDHNEAWTLARMHPNLYLDTSGNGLLRKQSREFYEYNILGWEQTFHKFIFGTDQYYHTWDDVVTTVTDMLDHTWQVDIETKNLIFYDNLAAILRWAGVPNL